MRQFGSGGFGSIPLVVKNLLIINIIMLLATWVVRNTFGIDLNRVLGLFFFRSESFMPIQIVTHMFMHGGLTHLFFNMFALWMFGRVLESVWGPKRFFIYYMVTGLGAVFLHTLVNYIGLKSAMNQLTPDQVNLVFERGTEYLQNRQVFTDPAMEKLQLILNTPTVGASGAVFGVLLGFGMLFPNTQLMLLFPPIPIKAKYFVIAYGALELYLGISQPGSNVAHFAHLGGMIFGFILIKYWDKTTHDFY
ncbi:MAG: rhomboid family intramembrane serine protease [Bacteroidota bacterium]